MKRGRLTALVAILCALVGAAPAAAETGDAAPIRNLDEGGFILPTITGPEAPDEYPFRVTLGEEQRLEQATPTEVQVRYGTGQLAFTLTANPASDAVGSAVPTTLTLTGPDTVTWTVTWTVSHRAGNPAAGGAPFVYPICTVPYLHGYGLSAVKKFLRDADCAIGKVRLARAATKAKGKVAKQFEPAGTQLPAGTPVAVKLAGR